MSAKKLKTMTVNYHDFIHPEDAAARKQLESIPGFETVVRYFMDVGIETYLHGTFMAEKIRLSPTQLPELYEKLPPICKIFGIPEPEFYLEMNPVPNAYTVGVKKTFVVVTSSLLEMCQGDELSAIIAHECGHIVCDHCLYTTMANYLLVIASMLPIVGNLVKPIDLGLKYWSRRAEFSADRAALVHAESEQPVVNALLRLTGGPEQFTGRINVEEYARQAEAYHNLKQNSTWHTLLQNVAIMNRTHPFSAVRISELVAWGKSNEFLKLKNAIKNTKHAAHCTACGAYTPPHSNFCKMCGSKINK